MGEVEFPSFVWLVEIGSDYALGLTRGEFDESYIELWEFDRNWSRP